MQSSSQHEPRAARRRRGVHAHVIEGKVARLYPQFFTLTETSQIRAQVSRTKREHIGVNGATEGRGERLTMTEAV
jgi:hypothetical protein